MKTDFDTHGPKELQEEGIKCRRNEQGTESSNLSKIEFLFKN